MYESVTQGEILQRMLAMVNVTFDKREGSIIFDALAPASVELQNAYIALASVLNESFADTASREYLIRRCAERGISPKPASYTIVKGKFTPASLEIPIGNRFSHDDLNYVVTEKIEDGLYYLQCETLGSEPNGVTGQLIPIDYIDGLQTAHIVGVSIPGEDEEDTETLRTRYFSSIQSEEFGGNRLDYKQKILSLQGVGGVKLYKAAEWNGGGTVKVVISNSDHDVPSEDLVEYVQGEIDPECLVVNAEQDDEAEVLAGQELLASSHGFGNGSGDGFAPIGHIVTVVGAYSTPVNVSFSLVYKSSYSWDNVQSSVISVIKSYFAELNENWQNTGEESGIVVRISQIESRLLTIPGIVDIQQTLLNGKAENLSVDKDSLVSIGDITHE